MRTRQSLLSHVISQGGPVVSASRPTAGSQPERSATTSLDGFTRTLSSALRWVEPLAHSEKGRGERGGGGGGGGGKGRERKRRRRRRGEGKGEEEEEEGRGGGGRGEGRGGGKGREEKRKGGRGRKGGSKGQLKKLSVHEVLLYYRLIV